MEWEPKSIRLVPTSNGSLEIVVYSLAPHGTGCRPTPLSYLQYIRNGMLKNFDPEGVVFSAVMKYPLDADKFASKLATEVAQGLGQIHPDGIIELPSTQEFNGPYTAAMRTQFSGAIDLSSQVTRLHKVKSGDGVSFNDVLADTRFIGNDNLDRLQTILLVDDIFEGGKTSGAVITRLIEAGLSSDTNFILAVPLVIFT